MNELIATVAIIALSFLLLWGVTSITLSGNGNVAGNRRTMRLRHFTGIRTAASTFAKQKSAKKIAVPEVAPQAAPPAQSPLTHFQAIAVQEAIQYAAQAALSIELEPPVQITQKQSLRGMDLRRVKLRGKNLVGADLSYCNLVRANLAGANLHGANLAYSDLSNAILVGTDLSETDCTGARFHGANLHGATLCNSNLTDTRFGPTTRRWADIYSLCDEPRHKWRTVDIVGANLRDIDLQEATCTGSDISSGRVDKGLYWTQW
jgi:hypothetical protein